MSSPASEKKPFFRDFRLLVIIVLLVVGLGFTLTPSKFVKQNPWVWWLGFSMIVAAIAGFLLFYAPNRDRDMCTSPEDVCIADRLLDRLTLRGKLIPLFPFLGVAIIVVDVLYNAAVVNFDLNSLFFGTHDVITILFGVVLVIFPFIPKDYSRERLFVTLFFAFLVLILVLPLMLARLFLGSIDASVNIYTQTMLAPQLVVILNLIGVDAWLENNIRVMFYLRSGPLAGVEISTSCSGLYSFSIFASGFSAFVMTEYRKFDSRVLMLLSLGVFSAYLANLFRMVIIVYLGYYFDQGPGDLQVLLLAHSNAGWIIFLVWISIFWIIMYKFLIKSDMDEMREGRTVEKETAPESCQACGECLEEGDVVFACRWCGKKSHAGCMVGEEKCPTCGEDVEGL